MIPISSLNATIIPIGLSAIIKVDVNQALNQCGLIKIFSGSGSLEIAPVPLALSGSSTVGWSLGYPIASSEAISFDGPCTFYLAAIGATMQAALLYGRSNGATLV